MTTIAWTGHRPKDLGATTQEDLYRTLNQLHVGERRDLTFITGGALGIDTWAAEYAIDHAMPLHIILPFTPETMGAMWSKANADRLLAHIEMATSLTIIDPTPTSITRADYPTYQRRNEAMIDRANHVFAVWTGKTFGGTWNAIQYATKIQKSTFNLWPLDGKLHRIQ